MAEDGLKDQLRKMFEGKVSEEGKDALSKAMEGARRYREENTEKTVAEIKKLGDSLAYGSLIGRFAELLGKKARTSVEQGETGVKYAALYHTFGNEGIEKLVAVWGKTEHLRKPGTHQL